jgi:hypothetical protein
VKNPKLIGQIRGFSLYFSTGRFDDWLVWLEWPEGAKAIAPTDEWYFGKMSRWDDKVGAYERFVAVYDRTTAEIDPSVFEFIDEIAVSKQEAVVLAVLYAGMVAEENKEHAILKKRIKRLGVFQVLVLEMDPKRAANFSRGKKVAELAPLMQQYGF